MFSRRSFQGSLLSGVHSVLLFGSLLFACSALLPAHTEGLDADKIPPAFPKELSVTRTAKNTDDMVSQLDEMTEIVEDLRDASQALNENAYFTAAQNEIMVDRLKSIGSDVEKCEENVVILRVNSEEFLKRLDDISIKLQRNVENTERIGDSLNILNELTSQMVKSLRTIASEAAKKGRSAQVIKVEKKNQR